MRELESLYALKVLDNIDTENKKYLPPLIRVMTGIYLCCLLIGEKYKSEKEMNIYILENILLAEIGNKNLCRIA